MRSIAFTLVASLSVAVLGGCGSSSAPLPATSSASSSNTSQPRKADATGTVKLILPAHVARASNSARRSPAYVNPYTSDVFVVTAKGTILDDPAHPSNAYFAMPAVNLTDGSATLTIPLVSGTYNAGDVVVSEYDGPVSGNLLASGSNQSYTDPVNGFMSGAFTVAPGGSTPFVVTLAMNATQVVFTTNISSGPYNVLSNNASSPTNEGCVSSGRLLYVFAADASSTFVLPTSGTPPGYTGGDPNNFYPGVPNPVLSYQFSNYGGKIVSSIIGSSTFQVVAANSSDVITAVFTFTDPYNQTTVEGAASFGPGNC